MVYTGLTMRPEGDASLVNERPLGAFGTPDFKSPGAMGFQRKDDIHILNPPQ